MWKLHTHLTIMLTKFKYSLQSFFPPLTTRKCIHMWMKKHTYMLVHQEALAEGICIYNVKGTCHRHTTWTISSGGSFKCIYKGLSVQYFQYTNTQVDGTTMVYVGYKPLFHTRDIFLDTERKKRSKSSCLSHYPSIQNLLQNPLKWKSLQLCSAWF